MRGVGRRRAARCAQGRGGRAKVRAKACVKAAAVAVAAAVALVAATAAAAEGAAATAQEGAAAAGLVLEEGVEVVRSGRHSGLEEQHNLVPFGTAKLLKQVRDEISSMPSYQPATYQSSRAMR